LAKRKSGRHINGILLLDKRKGVSSNRALQEVRRLFNANKAGHTGSLDPLATGLLPLCFGEATKVSALMLDDDKTYQVTIQLGLRTDTGDMEGAIIEQFKVPELTKDKIETCLQHFKGDIEQIPPMYSALKHQGKKLYELAREGKVIERKARKITLFKLQLLNFTANTLDLEVRCSKGTYIRSLAEDIGQFLGCGGTVAALRRIQSGIFTLDNAWTMDTLQNMDLSRLENCLLAVDQPLGHLPTLQLSPQQADWVKQGRVINFDSELSKQTISRLYSKGLFLGLGEILLDGKLAPRKIFNLGM